MSTAIHSTILAGEFVYTGATVWSNYHSKPITITSFYMDPDGDVYLCFDGGNANVKSCEWIAPADDE